MSKHVRIVYYFYLNENLFLITLLPSQFGLIWITIQVGILQIFNNHNNDIKCVQRMLENPSVVHADPYKIFIRLILVLLNLKSFEKCFWDVIL